MGGASGGELVKGVVCVVKFHVVLVAGVGFGDESEVDCGH